VAIQFTEKFYPPEIVWGMGWVYVIAIILTPQKG
jgi:hypothetical protein